MHNITNNTNNNNYYCYKNLKCSLSSSQSKNRILWAIITKVAIIKSRPSCIAVECDIKLVKYDIALTLK